MKVANDWMIDVLADLKAYAIKNGLQTTAQQLADTMLLASTEIASNEGARPKAASTCDERTAGLVY